MLCDRYYYYYTYLGTLKDPTAKISDRYYGNGTTRHDTANEAAEETDRQTERGSRDVGLDASPPAPAGGG